MAYLVTLSRFSEIKHTKPSSDAPGARVTHLRDECSIARVDGRADSVHRNTTLRSSALLDDRGGGEPGVGRSREREMCGG